VLKHVVLCLVLRHLREKEKPFFVLDTHAGVGRYDLAGEEASKTGEWRHGIGRVREAADPPAALAPYLEALWRIEPDGRFYPGSPLLASALLRPQDRLVACELHPEDAARLAAGFAADPRVAVRHADGFAAPKALLPPKERRGLVLLDPAYEAKDEPERLLAAVRQGLKRWAGGIYLAWYPIKDRAGARRLTDGLAGLGAPLLTAELAVFPGDWPYRLNGAGMAVLNPPWRLAEALEEALPWLARRLEREPGGGWRLERPAEGAEPGVKLGT